MPELVWTDERIERLKELYATGLSFRDIAKQITDVSKNACLGKAARMVKDGTLEQRAPYLGARRVAHLKRVEVKKAALPLPEPTTNATESLRISVRDIGDRQCRFIAGDPQIDSSMCGHTTEIGRSLCPSHDAVCWDKIATARYTARVHAAREDRRVR